MLSLYIAYCIELHLQLCNYAQKRCIFRENSKYTRLTKVMWPFLLVPKGCQLLPPCILRKLFHSSRAKILFRGLALLIVQRSCSFLLFRTGNSIDIACMISFDLSMHLIVHCDGSPNKKIHVHCIVQTSKPSLGKVYPCLIFVKGTTGGACVKKIAWCKFLQI